MLRDKILQRTHIVYDELLRQEHKIRTQLLTKPNDIKQLKQLGTILFYKRDCAGAVDVYEKLRFLGCNDGSVIGFLGYLNYELGNYMKSIEYFNIVLDRKPYDAFVHFLLGNAYSRVGKIIEAISAYEFAIFLDLDIYNAHLDFAKEYEYLGRYKKALSEYIAAYEIDPREKGIEDKIEYLKNKI